MQRFDSSEPLVGEQTEERGRRMTEDIEMADASGDSRISNAPQLPENPIYERESLDKRESVKE